MENTALIIDIISLCGKIILENGGEIYRAEDTITRILTSVQCTELEVYALPTGFFVGFKNGEKAEQAIIKRIKSRGTNLTKLEQVNQLSRAITGGKLSLAEAKEKLTKLQKAPGRNQWLVMVAAALSTGFFTFMFCGNVFDFLVGCLSGFTIQFAFTYTHKNEFFNIMSALFGSMIASLYAAIFSLFMPISPQIVIVSSMMPLFPGISMTNAVRDSMRGDLTSGLTRGVEALLVAVMLSLGTGIIYMAFRMETVITIELSMKLPVLLLSSFFGTLFFGFIQESPNRAIVTSACVGALSCLVYYLALKAAASPLLALFLGSFSIAFVSEVLARIMKMPTTTFISTSIVPLVPGIGLFLMMLSLVEQNTLDFVSKGVSATLQIGAMAMGLALDAFLVTGITQYKLNHRKNLSARKEK